MAKGGKRPGAGQPKLHFTLVPERAHILRRLAKQHDATPQMILDSIIDLVAAQGEKPTPLEGHDNHDLS